MKTYIATCAPRDTAPPGELGRPDWFAFEVQAADAAAAVDEARSHLAALFGDHALEAYTVTVTV